MYEVYDDLWRSLDPKEDIVKMLEETDLQIIRYEATEHEAIYENIAELKENMAPVAPTIKKIPVELQEEYMDEIIEAMVFQVLNDGRTMYRYGMPMLPFNTVKSWDIDEFQIWSALHSSQKAQDEYRWLIYENLIYKTVH